MSYESQEVRTLANSHLLNSVMITVIAGGIAWVLLELHQGRERWARVEERISNQSAHIVDMRVDLNTNLREWQRVNEKNGERLSELERRMSVHETRLAILEAKVNATEN